MLKNIETMAINIARRCYKTEISREQSQATTARKRKPSPLESYKLFARCNCYVVLGSGHSLCTGFVPLNWFVWIKAMLKVVVSPTDCSLYMDRSY